MKQYILKLKTDSTTNYAVYDGTTALTDAQLTALFTTAGSAYFTFDFDSLTPSATNALTIVDSSDTAVITNTNLTDTIVETKDFKGTWSASATAFDTFVALSGVAMDEAQLSDLMGKIKDAGGGKIIDVSDGDVSIGTSGGRIGSSDAGVYKIINSGSASHKIKIGNTWSYDIPVGYSATIILGRGPSGIGYGLLAGAGYDGLLFFAGSSNNNKFNVLSTNNLVNNLNTSVSGYSALDANQGRVLNTSITNASNRIGTLSSLTTTVKTSTVAAINEVNGKAVGTSETLTIATTDWAALSASDPYDYSATVTATTTISATSTVELINDQAVLFGTYGFAIGSVDTVNNTVTIYSIGQPSASVSLTIKVRS